MGQYLGHVWWLLPWQRDRAVSDACRLLWRPLPLRSSSPCEAGEGLADGALQMVSCSLTDSLLISVAVISACIDELL